MQITLAFAIHGIIQLINNHIYYIQILKLKHKQIYIFPTLLYFATKIKFANALQWFFIIKFGIYNLINYICTS